MRTREEISQMRRQWREDEARDIEAAKAELAQEHGLIRDAKFDRAWEIAWNYAHSTGIADVKILFDELADLIKP